MRLLVLFLLLSLNGFTQTLEESIQSLHTLSDSAQADSMARLARISAINDQPELGIKQAKWALKKAKENKIKNIIPLARYYVARNFNQANLIDSSIFHYRHALAEIENTKYDIWKIYIVSALGNNYRQKGDFKNAISIQLNAIKGFEEQSDSLSVAELYTEIGYTYDRMKDFETALKYHRKALKYLQNREPDYANFILGRIAIAYDDLGHYDSAHYYNFKVLAYEVENGDSTGVGMTTSNIGNTYLKQEKWDKSRKYLERAERLNLEYGDDGHKAITYINLGTAYMQLGLYAKAEQALDKGEQFSKAWDNTKFLSEAYFFKSALFEKMKKLDAALYYFKEYKLLEDSLYSLEKLNQIEEIKTKYETEKKEQQIELQKASLAEQESELKAKQRTILALVIFSVLIVVIAFTTYKRYKAKKNEEIQQRIIEEQEKGLEAVFLAQEEERKRIAKDLHDGVGQQLSGLKMAFQKLSYGIKEQLPEKQEEVENLAQTVSGAADEVRSISHRMMPRALTELGLVEAVEDMLQKSLIPCGIKYDFEHYGINQRLPEQKEVSLYRITQELINNIIKHSEANHVQIQLFKNSGKVILIVEDNGKGISKKSTKGHGLLNIKSRLNTINGEVNFEPSPLSGTLATIRIPI